MAEASAAATSDESQISYEDLAALEEAFDDADTEVLRHQHGLTLPLYAKRNAVTSKIPNFWPLVLEQAPVEVDQYIQPQDSRIFSESLTKIEVKRHELEADPAAGNPKSLTFRFEFAPNEDFEDTSLEKVFHQRRAKDGWTGLVSEPVQIRWKKGKDLTRGLTDGACALFEARKKAGDMTSTDVPEYQDLKKKVESWNGMNTSFFTWFGWVSGRRYVTAEESAEAIAKHIDEKSKRQAEKAETAPPTEAEIEEEIEAADDHDEDVEVHQAGEELAVCFADDVWPNAIKYFTEAQEMGEVSDAEFEDDDDEMDEDDVEGAPELVDMSELVKGKKGGEDKGKGRSASGGPPSKKVKR